VIRERLREYDLQTLPILNYFSQAHVPVLNVEAAGATPDQIVKRIWDELTEDGVVANAAPEVGVAPSGLK